MARVARTIEMVDIKRYRCEDVNEKEAFAEFTEVQQIETDFAAKVEKEFAKMIATAALPREGEGQ